MFQVSRGKTHTCPGLTSFLTFDSVYRYEVSVTLRERILVHDLYNVSYDVHHVSAVTM